MADIQAGTVIDAKYRILDVLGRGGMGIVYRAEQLDIEGQPMREVALKMLLAGSFPDPRLFRWFIRESRIAARLDSLHTVTVYDFGQTEDGQLYSIMELVRGPTLREILQNEAPLPVERVVHIAGHMCEALAEAHAPPDPIVHRDLKPANIFIEQRQGQDWVKIGDFGLAKVLEEQTEVLTQQGQTPGTPRYMAPEQWTGAEVDSRADLYALGLIIYAMLTGEPPFTGRLEVLRERHLHDPPPALPASVPAVLRDVVVRLLAKQPKDRFQDALSVRRSLESVVTSADEDRTIVLREVSNAPAAEESVEEKEDERKQIIHPETAPPRPLEFSAQREKRRNSLWVYGTLGTAIVLVAWLGTQLNLVSFLNGMTDKTKQAESIQTPDSPGQAEEARLEAQKEQQRPAEERRQAEEEEERRRQQAQRQEAERKEAAEKAQRLAEAKRQEEERRQAQEAALKKMEETQKAQATTPSQPRDGKESVSLPAGKFWMGCNEPTDAECEKHEKPGREVYVDAFFIDTYEVTVAEYRRCVEAGSCSTQALDTYTSCNWGKTGRDKHPMTCVDWYQAQAYCKWAGKHLPTEAEWEKAARGTDRRKYPWGNEWSDKKANTSGAAIGSTQPVGSYALGVSPYGAHDMAGNVTEWVQDWYAETSYQNGLAKNPRGAESGSKKITRGGGWKFSLRPRTSTRSSALPTYLHAHVGFRCAW